MKRKWLALLAAGLSAITVFSFAACTTSGSSNSAPTSGTSSNSGTSNSGTSNGGTSNSGTSDSTTPEVTKTRKEQVLEFMDSLNNIEITGANVYATSYDDMVSYLKEQKVIEADAQGVDMNTTAGYLWSGSDHNYASSARAFADKAYDYNGVYLVWWDIANGSSYTDVYQSINVNGRAIFAGGAFTFATASVNGYYAIGFSDFSKTMDQYQSGGSEAQKEGESSSDYDARQNAALKAAKAEHSSQITLFEAIDSTPPSIDYFTSVDQLSAQLFHAGLISIQQLSSPVDLNAVYTFGSDNSSYVALATNAYQYGDITVYFFDTSNSLYSYYTYSYMFTNLQKDKTTEVYYGSSNWYTEGQVYKYNENKAYDENGTTLTYSVDGIYGKFAISVAEEA
jgi:hypothetical protein